jgi:hypothetical protein
MTKRGRRKRRRRYEAFRAPPTDNSARDIRRAPEATDTLPTGRPSRSSMTRRSRSHGSSLCVGTNSLSSHYVERFSGSSKRAGTRSSLAWMSTSPVLEPWSRCRASSSIGGVSLWLLLGLMGLVKLAGASLMLWLPFRSDAAMVSLGDEHRSEPDDEGGTKALPGSPNEPYPKLPLPNRPRRGPHGSPTPPPPSRARPCASRARARKCSARGKDRPARDIRDRPALTRHGNR